MNWREWFDERKIIYSNASLGERISGGEEEKRYEAYKARLIEELAVLAPDLRTLGILVEKEESK